MRVHILLWCACVGQAIRRDLQFRSQTLINALASVLELALSAVPVLILTRDGGDVSGWNGPLAVAVVGAYGAGSGLIDCFVAPNMRRIDRYVRNGDLDLILTRPVNSFLHTSLRWSEPAELGRVLTGLLVLVLALRAAGTDVRPGAVAAALGWAVLGGIGFCLLWANFVYLAFWLESAGPMNDVAVQLRDAGRYPLAYYPRPVRLVLATVLPAGLIAATPVDALTGAGPPILVGAAGLALGLGLTLLHWKAALRRYGSASS